MKVNKKRVKLKGKADIEDGIFNKLENLPVIGKILILISDSIFFLSRNIFFFKKNAKRNIIIISFHRLGDTVFTIPAVREIFQHYKKYNIKIFCYPESKKIYEIEFSNNHLEILNKNDFKLGQRIATKKARNSIKNFNPEVIFDLTGTIASASLILNSSASKIVGMNGRLMKGIYTHFVKRRKTPHLIDNYLDIVNSVIPLKRTDDTYKFNIKS